MHNGPKCHLLLSSFNTKSINIKGSSIEKLLGRFLGIKIDNNFTFEKHMNEISRKDNLNLHALTRCVKFTSTEKKRLIFNSNLGGSCWFSLNNSETVKAVTLAFCRIQ